MIVFVYEDICANAAGGDDVSPPAASLLREGRAMLDAVTADFRRLPRIEVKHAASSNDFIQLAKIADYTLVIAPETGGRLELLASEVFRVGGRLLGPSPDAIQLTSDKLLLSRHWEAKGVSTPRTWLLGEESSEKAVVLKPRDGAGSQDMRLAKNLIVQQYVAGFAASVAFLVGPRAAIPLVPCAQQLSADGRFQYEGGYLPIATDLANRTVQIAAHAIECVPGLLGYVGVDVVLGDDGRDWAIEINPRLTTSYVGLRALAKFNIAEAMLAIARGDLPPAMNWDNVPIQFTPDGQLSPLAA